MYAQTRPSASELLKDIGERARLTVYLGAAPGVGKTHRLLTEARQMLLTGLRVMIGWVETKGRPDLEELCAGIQRVPPRTVEISGAKFADFDFKAAVDAHPQVL